MKYVLFYETAGAPQELLEQHFPAHRARWREYQEAGSLLLIGPFSDRSGALAVFSSKDAAEEFATGDPFVLHGAVSNWYVREWMEAIFNP